MIHYINRQEYEPYNVVDAERKHILDVIWYNDTTHVVCQAVRNPNGSLKIDGFRRGIETIIYNMSLLIVHSDTGEEFNVR